MEPVQPANRVPADPTPPDGQPPVTPATPAPDEPVEPTADAPPSVRPSERGRRPRDMAISLLVLLIPIALLFVFYRGFLGGDQPISMDPAPAVEQARDAGLFPVSEPTGLGPDWHPVRASYQTVEGGANLRIGYVTPEGRGAQLVQSNVPAERLLPAELTAEGQPQGSVDLAGRSWQRYTARGNEQAYVLLEPNRTVLVVGDARDNELRQLVTSLG
ncbi:DUF4245 domain-containing protein [Micromonospora yangpuensis]|uniref:DUF4245 domain-containing protein n=1 Tax=Micromonospora yangpuensis TaxID=683228 RepID=UPI000B852877|nr:DUF4245 domain-containing protein [Micromonospora yangpuensis]GGL90871.1 hypothetical protein GCM10012279_05810 [Micromonospora yangpuensis]